MALGTPEKIVINTAVKALAMTPRVVFYAVRPHMKPEAKLELWRHCVSEFDKIEGAAVLMWRQNTGGAMMPTAQGRMMAVQFGIPGTADLIGVGKPGARWVCFEAKSSKRGGKNGTGKYLSNLSEAQEVFAGFMMGAGGFYYVFRSAEDAVRAVNDVLDELSF